MENLNMDLEKKAKEAARLLIFELKKTVFLMVRAYVSFLPPASGGAKSKDCL